MRSLMQDITDRLVVSIEAMDALAFHEACVRIHSGCKEDNRATFLAALEPMFELLEASDLALLIDADVPAAAAEALTRLVEPRTFPEDRKTLLDAMTGAITDRSEAEDEAARAARKAAKKAKKARKAAKLAEIQTQVPAESENGGFVRERSAANHLAKRVRALSEDESRVRNGIRASKVVRREGLTIEAIDALTDEQCLMLALRG